MEEQAGQVHAYNIACVSLTALAALKRHKYLGFMFCSTRVMPFMLLFKSCFLSIFIPYLKKKKKIKGGALFLFTLSFILQPLKVLTLFP